MCQHHKKGQFTLGENYPSNYLIFTQASATSTAVTSSSGEINRIEPGVFIIVGAGVFVIEGDNPYHQLDPDMSIR